MNITAHRGVSSLAPENTLTAFRLAPQYGCEWIEIDVQLSQDLIPVVIHDQTVNRCTNGSGKVADMTLTQLKKLDAGLWFSEQYRGEKIPTLHETLKLVQALGCRVNIELKVYPQDDVAQLCAEVAKVIDEAKLPTDQLLFSSFDRQALQLMQRCLPQIRRGQLWQSIPPKALEELDSIEAYSVHCDYRFLLPEQAQQMKQAGYQLYCYTANFPELVEQHWDWGVNMMISDRPQAYQPVINQVC
ncbi:glycerophosphoryl diester phosphodiesterase [Vibrio hippocampi]|uniref:Glycerophosphodiester phosphodiesterase, cytoplasmic n=1 Tax=Vibrio hippocampi TaxID=654686 RepID=A0ABN8DMC5_9VIBR|nr:glycerophosphoryl diester phosphodiesterase [Vibrio hippocampi]CAH0528704.1 Glycerophosphodiester phosphodiesterase, cytoplasmic [Vibrio hippocampi]